jgi:hypothetical protein
VSPIVSSGNSTNSNSSAENLEIAPASNNPNRYMHRPQPIVYAEKDIFDRLHTSTTRKVGEAPLYDSPPPVKIKTPTTVVTQETKPKKARWSILGKKSTAVV